MRIELTNDREVNNVYLFLSRAEIAELVGALEELMEHFEENGWHAHVSSHDYQREITVAADSEGDLAQPWDGGSFTHSMATPKQAQTDEV
ncbi:MAG: hypothetical protein JJU45_01405 [Acidimicrobiia bacterium]|nr:hypothetical protein [Acidimicrobiia bacterium]